ncbi:hypothetical protein NDU88_004230 [Pleurodeles waltl]|uniref:Uncharacterized protein n=1 Tax=Pleurodeles waltl TaxID=8319 RepID=A0AAV7V2E7_PLEWA|nr:hypothetical protein NDU88_004230 [Pleurodeles waltl]
MVSEEAAGPVHAQPDTPRAPRPREGVSRGGAGCGARPRPPPRHPGNKRTRPTAQARSVARAATARAAVGDLQPKQIPRPSDVQSKSCCGRSAAEADSQAERCAEQELLWEIYSRSRFPGSALCRARDAVGDLQLKQIPRLSAVKSKSFCRSYAAAADSQAKRCAEQELP